jgi:TonB family protein
MAGTVMVSFCVDTSGMVVSAGVIKSDISEAEFIADLLAYLKSIRFRPVPKNAGSMTFTFPFEFKAES